MKEKNKLVAGTIVTLPAVKDCPDFMVLEDYENGTVLCITKNTVGFQRFSDDERVKYNEEGCTLRAAIDRWLTTLANNGLNTDKIISRKLFPSAWMGRGQMEEKTTQKAYPLTLDEYCYYRRKVPEMRTSDGEWWLRTQDFAGYRYCVNEDGRIGSFPQDAINAVRPALIASKDILTTKERKDTNGIK